MKIEFKKPPGRIMAAVLTLLGGSWNDLGALGGASSSAGVSVSQDSMMKLSAVWACTKLISETIATLPLSVYERGTAGKRIARQHPLHFIIHDQPNADVGAAVFWESVVAGMLLRGAARVERLYVGDRQVGLSFLHPDRLHYTQRSDGTRDWTYTDTRGRQRSIADKRIWTIPGFSLDGENGVSVIQYSAEVMGSAMAAASVANSTFANGLHQTVALKYPQTLRVEQRTQAREALSLLSGGLNAGKPVILEAGTDVVTVGIKPVDAQLLESRAFSVEEICRWFRVPPFMVGHSEKSTSWGTGIEQQMIGFLTFTLAPWLKRIEQYIEKDLLTPAERRRYYVKFNVEGLLRADSSARGAFYTAMVDKGIMTRDQVREKEDMDPMGGNAAVLTVQAQMVPLDSIGLATEQPPEEG